MNNDDIKAQDELWNALTRVRLLSRTVENQARIGLNDPHLSGEMKAHYEREIILATTVRQWTIDQQKKIPD